MKTAESGVETGSSTIFWAEADGVYIPKEQLLKLLNQFRPISLLNVKGKIFFGVLTGRLVQFLLVNCLVDT